MPSKKPTPGRCNAKLKDGYCQRRPSQGSDRCNYHGGTRVESMIRDGRGDGLTSKKYRNLRAAGEERLAYLLADPDLMDPKQPVAISRFILDSVLMDPDEAALDKLAIRLAEQDGLDPKDVDAGHRARARGMVHEEARKILALHGRLQQDALKVERQKIAVVGVVVPVLERIAKSITEIAASYIESEADRERFLEAVRNRLRAGLGEAVAAVEDSEAKWKR